MPLKVFRVPAAGPRRDSPGSDAACYARAMEPLAFGPFLLDAARGTLTRDGAPVALGQRALAVLAALAEAPGRTVPRRISSPAPGPAPSSRRAT